MQATVSEESRGRILIVDDEPAVLRAFERAVATEGHAVETAADGTVAASLFRAGGFDAIVSDISMPGMDGIQLLRAVRERDLDVPVILVTANPDIETAVQAVEFGALRYLEKPVDMRELRDIVTRAVRLHRLAKVRREALAHLEGAGRSISDKAGLEAAFGRGLDSIWMAYQPIVDWHGKRIFGYEALVRTSEPSMPHPGVLFDAAERLGRLRDLGRAIRAGVGATAPLAPPGASLFVNLHTHDLKDEELYGPDGPLAPFAKQIVLEITERASLDEVTDLRSRVARLRDMGFRIAIDDLGAGYAGLTAFAQLEPEVVKLDMSLVRNMDTSATKQKLVRSMTELCHEIGMCVVAEGVETVEEKDLLTDIHCDLLQGYIFAKPSRGFVTAIEY